MIVKNFAFLAVETIFFEEKRQLQYHFELIFESPQRREPLSYKWERTRLFALPRQKCGLDFWVRIELIDNHFCREIEKIFEHTKFPSTFFLGQYTFPKKSTMLLSHCQSESNVLRIVIALTYFTLACNLLSVLTELMNFTVVTFDNFSE